MTTRREATYCRRFAQISLRSMLVFATVLSSGACLGGSSTEFEARRPVYLTVVDSASWRETHLLVERRTEDFTLAEFASDPFGHFRDVSEYSLDDFARVSGSGDFFHPVADLTCTDTSPLLAVIPPRQVQLDPLRYELEGNLHLITDITFESILQALPDTPVKIADADVGVSDRGIDGDVARQDPL